MSNNDELHRLWHDPPREHGALPLWFWNDDLRDDEVLRQIREFHAKGFGGFTVHPRIGLSRRIGYLTDEYFRLFRLAVDEAARLEMKVAVTDEGSYPSGSACGQVVAENPDYAQRCLIALHHKVDGPSIGYWRPNPGRALRDRLLCVIAARETAPDVLEESTLTILPHDEHELVRYDVPEGRWHLTAVWEVFSGSSIRGVLEEEDDRHATAPPAGDILSPLAMQCYIRLTHDRIYQHLKDHFGKTFIAIFTDEPSPLGRYPQRGPQPWEFSPGFLDDVARHWDQDVRRWLPALWLNCGSRTPAFRQAWKRMVADRLNRAFYAPQSEWCRRHGIALTGHPQSSNEIAGMRHLHWPGQDLVWRYVEPNSPTASEGPDSVCAKAASSAAATGGARFNAMETLGAYGWRLTLDEVKWLLDWHLVRGNNLHFLHACFYSIRGRRAYESEPDIGLHNPWWPYFGLIGHYLRRLCWLITDGQLVCDVGIVSDPTALSWRAAAELQRRQIDYVFVDIPLLEKATIQADGRLRVGAMPLRAIVIDDARQEITPAACAQLDAFGKAGGLVIEYGPALAQRIVEHVGLNLDARGLGQRSDDLRVLHYRKSGREFYLLVNEGEDALEGEISVACAGSLERWDALDGSARPWPARAVDGRMHLRLRLDRRESAVLAIDPAGQPLGRCAPPMSPGAVAREITTPWQAFDAQGNRANGIACPGDWARQPGWETFAGTIVFRTTFDLPPEPAGQTNSPAFLDLGAVGDIAEISLNGQPLGIRAWRPYIFDCAAAMRFGSSNTLEVRVTNSIANRLNGAQSPSGLMGPVILRQAQSSPSTY